jgi:small subunit ribosomal protein S5e
MLLSTGLSLITSFFLLVDCSLLGLSADYLNMVCSVFFYDLLLLLLATRLTIFLIYNSGPREDATRIGSAGVVRRQAVDISPLRRVNQALYLLTTGAREAAFRNIKTIAECLADELINAAKGSSNRFFSFLLGCSFHNCFSVLLVIVFIFFSYAIKKKDEIERVAKANR